VWVVAAATGAPLTPPSTDPYHAWDGSTGHSTGGHEPRYHPQQPSTGNAIAAAAGGGGGGGGPYSGPYMKTEGAAMNVDPPAAGASGSGGVGAGRGRDDHGREHKIRIVERLGTVSSVLLSEAATGTPGPGQHGQQGLVSDDAMDVTSPGVVDAPAAAAALSSSPWAVSAAVAAAAAAAGSSGEALDADQQTLLNTHANRGARPRAAPGGLPRSALRAAVAAGGPGPGGGVGGLGGDVWLDDAQLALLSTADLERLMDQVRIRCCTLCLFSCRASPPLFCKSQPTIRWRPLSVLTC